MKTESALDKPLHIVSLEINNLLRLSAVKIVPDGDVTLTGPNMAGKSSVLNVIAMVFGGADFVPPRPINEGASKGNAVIDMGDVVAELKFSASGKTIELKAGDTRIKSPATVLESFWNKTCDPKRFIDLSITADGRRKQLDILRKLVGVDLTEINKKRESLFDARTLNNRDLTTAQAKLNGMTLYADAPVKEILVTDLMAELEEAQNVNKAHARERESLRSLQLNRDDIAAEAKGIRLDIEELEKTLATKKADLLKVQSGFSAASEVLTRMFDRVNALEDVDENPIKEKIKHAAELNRMRANNIACAEAREKVHVLSRVSSDQTDEIAALDQEKSDLLEKAPFPLPSISFNGDEGILLDGMPFEQASQAEQLYAATAIGMALKPRLRVVLIREGSLFDDTTMAKLKALAREHDFQVWMEQVRSDDPSAITIQDGSIKE